jgi:hypothetical protein
VRPQRLDSQNVTDSVAFCDRSLPGPFRQLLQTHRHRRPGYPFLAGDLGFGHPSVHQGLPSRPPGGRRLPLQLFTDWLPLPPSGSCLRHFHPERPGTATGQYGGAISDSNAQATSTWAFDVRSPFLGEPSRPRTRVRACPTRPPQLDSNSRESPSPAHHPLVWPPLQPLSFLLRTCARTAMGSREAAWRTTWYRQSSWGS